MLFTDFSVCQPAFSDTFYLRYTRFSPFDAVEPKSAPLGNDVQRGFYALTSDIKSHPKTICRHLVLMVKSGKKTQ